MWGNSLSSLGRGNSPGPEPLDHAEQGFRAALTNPPKAQQSLSLRSLLRRSNPTPEALDEPHEMKLGGCQSNVLPTQGKLCSLEPCFSKVDILKNHHGAQLRG